MKDGIELKHEIITVQRFRVQGFKCPRFRSSGFRV